jgi:hypothetical protein
MQSAEQLSAIPRGLTLQPVKYLTIMHPPILPISPLTVSAAGVKGTHALLPATDNLCFLQYAGA